MNVDRILDDIQDRALAATKGPWKLWGMSVLADPVGNSNLDDGIPVANTHMRDDQGKPRTFDAEFIAHARTDVPSLVAALRAVLALADGHLADLWITHQSGVFEDVAGTLRLTIEKHLDGAS